MRLFNLNVMEVIQEFQSTHPLRDATLLPVQAYALPVNFNPRTPYGMRLS